MGYVLLGPTSDAAGASMTQQRCPAPSIVLLLAACAPGCGGAVIDCDVVVPVDDVQILTLILRAPAIIPAGLESIENTARADHGDIDPTPENNVDAEDTPVIANPDLEITKDDGVLVART